MSKSNKIVILTGAGALFPWKDKGMSISSTIELTDALRNDTTYTTNCGEPLGEFFYRVLTNIMQPEYVNFERIIDLLDNLCIFLIQEDSMTIEKKFSQDIPLKKAWVENGYIDQNGKVCPEACIPDNIKGLDIRTWYPSGYTPGLYDLRQGISDRLFDTANYKGIEQACGKGQEIFAKKIYIKNILYHFVDLIAKRIERYAIQPIPSDASKLNTEWNDFLKYLDARFQKIRIYTLNYDCLPVKISNFNFFDGFNQGREPDLIKLWQDDDGFSYINLHGSIHWDYDKKSMNWHCDPQKTFFSPKYARQKRKNLEDMPKFNIITGLQKPFRVLDQPFYNFYQKFAFDCSNADAIVTIGYSYGDEHVNKAIGMIRTKHLIDIVKDSAKHKNMIIVNSLTDIRRGSINADIFNIKNNNIARPTNNSYVVEKDVHHNLKIYFQGFEEFLNEQEWEPIFA